MSSKARDLRAFLQLLRKRRSVMAIVFACIFGLTLVGTFMVTPVYEGKVQIIIERVQPDNLTGSNRYQLRDPEFEKTQIQLIRSQVVARRVVDLLHLENNYEAFKNPQGLSLLSKVRKQVAAWFSRGERDPLPEQSRELTDDKKEWTQKDRTALDISKYLLVQPLQGSHITEIRYSSPNPVFSAMVANTYVKAYLEETLEMKMDATRRNLGWMTQKAEDERMKLQTTEKSLQEYMEQHNLVALEDRISIMPEALSQLGGDLIRAESKTKETKLLYDKVKAVANNSDAAEAVLSISEGTTLEILRAESLKAEQHIIELSGKYGSKHPTMLKAVADLKVLKDKRRQEINRIINKVRNRYELAQSNENSIRATLDQTKAEAIVLNEKYVQYSALKREIETNRNLYEALLGKIKNQSITGETRPVNIWIVENAKVPTKPIRPKVFMNMIMGLIFGICCATGCAFLVDHLDNRIKAPEGTEDILGVPVIGTVVFDSKSGAIEDGGRSRPRTEFVENFNALLTTLQLSSPESPPKRLLITSSMAGEGKTTTAINLARTMAKNGSRVLLIDADMRKPKIHKAFNLKNKTGLSSYLAGAAGRSIINKATDDNLVILPAGPTPPNPYDLLNSKRMKHLIENIDHEFDSIICDTPPVLSVADSRVLSHLFDGVIVVTRARTTPFPMAQKSLKLLQSVNSRILGVLINAVQADDQEYYRYYSSYLQDSDSPETPAAKTVVQGAGIKEGGTMS